MASEEKHLDYGMLEELKEIMEDEFLELLKIFLSDSEVRVKNLKSAHLENDHDNVRSLAHSFKGSSSNIGAHALSELCKEVEVLAKDGGALDARRLIDEIDAEFQLVSSELMKVVAEQ